MANFIFLLWGLIPVGVGVGFLMRPRRMVRAQSQFRKKMEKLEKKLYRSHRVTGLCFLLLGTVFLASYFYPVWIFKMFLVGRIILGALFPELFRSQAVAIVPTVWI